MKHLNFYQETYGVSESDQVFQALLGNLKPSNMLWSYFVNWNKVFDQIEKLEWSLSLLNCLVGKPNFDDELKNLLTAYPSVISALPQLAVRVSKGHQNLQQFTILVDYSQKKLKFARYDFSHYDPREFERYVEFMDKTGIKKLLTDGRIKNLVDYMIGVEAGLDSNARKNRSGQAMEIICEAFIKDWCRDKNYEYSAQANANKIQRELNWELAFDLKQERKTYDFAVKAGDKLFIFEVNFYNGTGSKLDKTVSDYMVQFTKLRQAGIHFIWLTDGLGWRQTLSPLKAAFTAIDHIFTLDMLEKGVFQKEF